MQTNWHNLGDAIYRKWSVYEIPWIEKGIHIENYQVCGSQLGGPLALVKSTAKEKTEIYIFTSAGFKLSQIESNSIYLIVGIGWSDLEQLIIVHEDGSCRLYDIHGVLVKGFQLLESSSGSGKILECHFWGNGVAAISNDMQVYVTEGLATADVPIRKFKIRTGLTPERPYTSMAVIPPLFSRSNIVEVILGTTDSSILVADENCVEDQLLQGRIASPVIKIAISPRGLHFALYRRDGVLTVLDTKFEKKVVDFDTRSLSRPLDMIWCGDDAVVLLWRNSGVVMVGPFGDWINFPYYGPVYLVTEPDCCRIITSDRCEVLQMLPAPIEAVRKIGSTDPAALMYDAMEAFEEGDPKSDDNICAIAASEQLLPAVSTCILAATSEFDILRQQSFLKAASYGKAFYRNTDPSEFVNAALCLKVLNEVRRPEIGLPLTIQQYTRLTPDVLIRRLTIRNHHLLGIKICDLLKLKKDRVLVHWAYEKVRIMSKTSSTDEDIFVSIRRQLERYSEKISFSEIADAAHRMGRRVLAKMLLDLEPDPHNQILLLLSMKEEETALSRAVASQDSDLICLVLLNLDGARSLDKARLYQLIQPYPEAQTLLKTYYQTRVISIPGMVSSNTPVLPESLLHDLLLANKNYIEAGIAAAYQAYSHTDIDQRINGLKELSKIYSMGRGDAPFLKSATDEQIELLDMQHTLEKRTGQIFVGLSLSQTLYNLALLTVDQTTESSTWEREINKLLRRFRVSDKSLWHIKLQCYARSGAWDALKRLASEKKSPIGYKPFARICIKYKRKPQETEWFVDKVIELDDKFDLYVELGLWNKAFDVAAKLKDSQKLIQIGNACHDPHLERQIQELSSRI